MLRITPNQSPGRLTLKLEGKLLAPWIGELLAAAASFDSFAGQRGLDLSELTFADDAGVRALRDLAVRGFSILSCSQFVSELLQTVQP